MIWRYSVACISAAQLPLLRFTVGHVSSATPCPLQVHGCWRERQSTLGGPERTEPNLLGPPRLQRHAAAGPGQGDPRAIPSHPRGPNEGAARRIVRHITSHPHAHSPHPPPTPILTPHPHAWCPTPPAPHTPPMCRDFGVFCERCLSGLRFGLAWWHCHPPHQVPWMFGAARAIYQRPPPPPRCVAYHARFSTTCAATSGMAMRSARSGSTEGTPNLATLSFASTGFAFPLLSCAHRDASPILSDDLRHAVLIGAPFGPLQSIALGCTSSFHRYVRISGQIYLDLGSFAILRDAVLAEVNRREGSKL